jgi:DNA (cytosine-5)-methyltransferase 1
VTFGSLFSGIGGMDLGLTGAGMRCVWQCEIDPFCRRVLAKHWPDVRRHDDVRTFPPSAPEGWACDLICGGFPCQDVSLAGRGAGIDGARSGLWRELVRVVRLLRPRYVLVENSPALTNRGLSRLLGSLAELGFDAEWAVLPASAFGACHIRARMFIVAYPQRPGRDGVHEWQQTGRVATDPGECCADVPGGDAAAHPTRPAPDADRPGRAVGEEQILLVQQPAAVGSGWWAVEPDVGRVVHGFPGRVERIKALGNAVVPQVAEWIGRRLAGVERDA